jgi:calmodulin
MDGMTPAQVGNYLAPHSLARPPDFPHQRADTPGLVHTPGQPQCLPPFLQVSLMKQGFGLFAEEGTGKVTVEGLGDAMRSLGSNPSRQLLEDIGKEIASTGGTGVDFPEFLTLLSRAKKATEANGGEDAELEQAFKVYNRSQSGVVSAKEIFDFYKSISQDVPIEDVRHESRLAAAAALLPLPPRVLPCVCVPLVQT